MGLHPVALTRLLKEIEKGGRGKWEGEGGRGRERRYITEGEREREGGRVRERENASERARECVCFWLYAGVDWGVGPGFRDRNKNGGTMARNLKVMDWCCSMSHV